MSVKSGPELLRSRAVFVLSVAVGLILTVTTFSARRGGLTAPADPTRKTSAEPETIAVAGTLGPVIPALLFNFLVFFNYSIWVSLPLYTERRFDATAEDNANRPGEEMHLLKQGANFGWGW